MKQSNILKLDIDLDYATFKQLIRERTEVLLNWLGLEYTSIRIQPSQNKHIHVWVILTEDIPMHLVNLYQVLLGDDAKRYYFNELREPTSLASDFNILFSKKLKKAHIEIFQKSGMHIHVK